MSDNVQKKDAVPEVKPADQPVIPLQAEELEPVIAPRLAGNHNETILA